MKRPWPPATPSQAQLQRLDPALIEIAGRLRRQPPQVAMTIARGSSDHAASYFAYLAMQHVGIPVASLPMSVVTLLQAPLKVSGQVAFGFSQSGQSPDLVNSLRLLRKRGALSIAMVNAEDSPLEAACEFHVPLCAGAGTQRRRDQELYRHPQRQRASGRPLETGSRLAASLPGAARRPARSRHPGLEPAIDALRDCQRLMVIGRGAGFAIAQEAALKLKETSAIQAEAFSSAEVRHGPMALIGDNYPLLVFAPRGAEQAGLLSLAADMRQRGARVLLAAPDDIAERDLTLSRAEHPSLDPILAIQSFYVMAAGLARRPRHGPGPAAPPEQSHPHSLSRCRVFLMSTVPMSNNNNELTLSAPLSGPVLTLGNVPDEVFASGAMGDGIAIDPLNDCLHAPCDGVIIHVARTGHALTIRADNGAEVLMHVGIDTVELKGEGFALLVKDGARVSQGQALVQFDLDRIARQCKSLVSLIILTNGEHFELRPVALKIRQGRRAVAAHRRAFGSAGCRRLWITPSTEASASVRITHRGGLHARPAALIRKTAQGFSSQAQLHFAGKSAPCDSLIGLMGLGIGEGTKCGQLPRQGLPRRRCRHWSPRCRLP